MQWCLNRGDIEGSNKLRGNLPYAFQEQRPDWLSKEGFLCLANMRAYPFLSLRNLCNTLKNKSLPLDHQSVHTLFRQTLYNIGPLLVKTSPVFSSLRSVHLSWRLDFEDIMDAIFYDLEIISDELKEMPCQYKACRIIGEISCYFSAFQIHPKENLKKFSSIGRKLATAALSWAELSNNDSEIMSPEKLWKVRSKQIIFYRIAALCLLHGNMDESNVQDLVFAIVKSQNVFTNDNVDINERALWLVGNSWRHCQ